MKKWLIITGGAVILLVGGYLLLSFYGVKLIQARLQKGIGPGVTLSEIGVKPTHLSIKGIRYDDPLPEQRFLQVEEMRIYPDLLSLLKRRLSVREWTIIRPSFFFYRTPDGATTGPLIPLKKEEKGQEVSGKRTGEDDSFRVEIKRLKIKEGSLYFEDKETGEISGRFRLRELSLDMRDIQYPVSSVRSPVEFEAKVEGKTKRGEISLKGWINLKTIDLEASLRVREMELKIFEPYYRKRVTAVIESGHMNMDAGIVVKNRRIDVPGQMELADLHIGNQGTVFYLPAETLIAQLKDRGNRVQVRFHVKGNMDDPRFTIQEVFLTPIALAFAEALGLPVKGGEGFAEELRSLKDLFKKEKKKR
jgi:hypothetical protein